MEARWLFTAFDWGRFHEVAPRLQAAGGEAPVDFEDVEGAEGVLEEFDEEAPQEEVHNALLVELCTVGDGALFERGLPELLKWLRRQPQGEEPAEILGGMLSVSPGVEDWFAAEVGLVGVLTIEETSELARLAGRFRRSYKPPHRAKGLAALTRHFRTSEPAVEHLDELFEVIDESAAEMLGLAVIRVE
jgi:hypothetical protein